MKHIFKYIMLSCLVLWFPAKSIAQNTPPEVTRIEILPGNPTLDDDLTCSYDYYDADGDPEDVSQRFVAWQRNGIWQTEFRDQLTVPSSATGDNEEWEVFLRVHDGTDQSITYRASVTFGTPQPNTAPEAREVEILPDNPTSSDDLTLSYTYYDAEGDPEDESQRFIAWQRNGEWTHQHREYLTIPASDTRKGETWRAIISVNDGKDQSAQVWADPVTIDNSPPQATNLSLTPTNPSMYDALIASYTYNDPDDDPENGSEIRWYRDTVLQPDYNDQLTVPASATSGGEEWYFTVRPMDGEDFGELQTSSIVNVAGPTHNLAMAASPVGWGTTDPAVGVHAYYEGTVVTITATPDEGYQFVNWTGNVADPNSPTTTVTMSEDQSVTANFESQRYELTIAISPAGGGTTSPAVGAHTYERGEVVNVIATPAEGYRFVSWTGDVAAPNDASTTVTMSTDQSIIANFEALPAYDLTIAVSPEGSGTTDPAPGVHTYYEGTVVNIIATPTNEYQFVNWTGDVADPNDPTTTITMIADQLVTANFEPTPEVISTPNTPVCDERSYKMKPTRVTTSGSISNLGHEIEYQFDWGDGRISGWGDSTRFHRFRQSGLLQVRARARCQIDTDVISEWSERTEIAISPCTVNLTIAPPEAGHVNREPDTTEYDYDQKVTLTAVPCSSIYVFDHWNGDISGTNNPETLNMKGEHNVAAHFRMVDETVSTPDSITGPNNGFKSQNLTFTTGGAVSNLGHEVEYQFDWGNGSQSNWGIPLRSYTYSDSGTYQVKVRARCKTHTDILSEWSISHIVTILACELTISINPSDVGSVSKNPDKLGYDYGDTVSLTAKADTGWKFADWSGDHTGNNNPATISVTKNMSITANFEKKTYTLTTHVTPNGVGNIIKSPDKPSYTHGEIVTCTAIANPDSFYQFDHWSEDATGTTKSVNILMNSAKSITGHFSRMEIMPPHLENCYPPLNASEIPKNTSIHLSVKDKAVGIALNSLQILVNGTEIVNNGVDATGGNVFIESENKNYKIKYVPLVEFPEKSAVTVRVKCNNLAGVGCDSSYTFNIGTSNISITKIDTISIMGGSVKDTTTHVEITIPAGALEESTEIIIALVDMLPALPDSAKGIGLGYYFGPAGLKLNNPVTLSIPYSQSDLNEAGVDDPMKLSIYYFSTTKGNWTILNNTGVDTTAGFIFCQIDEFCYLTFGKKAATGVSGQHISSITPLDFDLMQNYPNPFNPETMIQYQLPKTSYVRLEVFNILGERIRTLVSAKQSAGSYQIIWDGKNDAGTATASGIYIYALRAHNITLFKKAIFMK